MAVLYIILIVSFILASIETYLAKEFDDCSFLKAANNFFTYLTLFILFLIVYKSI